MLAEVPELVQSNFERYKERKSEKEAPCNLPALRADTSSQGAVSVLEQLVNKELLKDPTFTDFIQSPAPQALVTTLQQQLWDATNVTLESIHVTEPVLRLMRIEQPPAIVVEVENVSSPPNDQVRNAAAPGPDRPRRPRLRHARAPPDVSRDPAHRDQTSDASAAPIALDLLWFGTARTTLLAWQGPHSGHFARQRPARLPKHRLSTPFPP
eukprot:6756119-Prymnesium_polylepis.1